MTSGELYKALMDRVPPDVISEFDSSATDALDLGKQSLEHLVDQIHGNARALRSEGSLRLSGGPVTGHAAPLEDVGRVATDWQKFVTAVGASLEGRRNLRGTVGSDVEARTRLAVEGIGAGSVVLRLTASSPALAESEPDGEARLVDTPRPLADRAVERSLSLLDEIASAGPQEVEQIARDLLKQGPRVANTLRHLADTIAHAQVTVDGSWREPTHGTTRGRCTPSQAEWIRKFIDGRDLEEEEMEIAGEAITVSSRERWLIDTEDGPIKVGVTDLAFGEQRVSPGDHVRLMARVKCRTTPDGRTSFSYEALTLLDATAPES